MASSLFPYCYDGESKISISKWRVSKNFAINQTPFVIFTYRDCDNDGNVQGTEQKYKINKSGIIVKKLYKKIEDIIEPEDVLFDYELCTHPTLMKDLCAICGININNFDSSEQRKIAENTSVSMVHSIPELRVSKKVAEDLGRADEDRLLKARKLVLLVDLDQTIVHSTNQNISNKIPDIYHYQLYGPNSPWYHTKFRPFMMEFLEEISKYYELHICTFGARRYAHQIANLIDMKCKYFPKDRILSRDEFFDPRSKTGNMKSLFPCGDSMVCIIDDRVDVWNYSSNVVHVKPYLCFKTDDINAPEKLNIGFKGSNNETKAEEQDADKSDNIISEKNEEINTDFQKQTDVPKVSSKDDPKDDLKVASKDDLTDEPKVTSKDDPKDDLKDDPKVAPKDDLKDDLKVDSKDDLKDVPKDDLKVDLKDDPKDVPKDDLKNQISKKKVETEVIKEGQLCPVYDEYLLDDKDDYLLYLKDILMRIHKEFYKEYDEKIRYKCEDEEILIPNLKKIIPRVRKLVLHGVNIVFSGVIATNLQAQSNRYYRLAESLGAIVTNNIIINGSPMTTHLVAAKWGTVKVNKCLKHGKIKIVTPEWLIVCAERWEKVDEELFKLTKNSNFNLNEKEDGKKIFIPYHSQAKFPDETPSPSSSSSESGSDDSKTMLELSPLSSFSMNDLDDMGKEVDDACSDGDYNANESSGEDSSDDEKNPPQIKSLKNKPDFDEEDEIMNYANEGEYPQGWNKLIPANKRGLKRPNLDLDDDEDNLTNEDSDDQPNSSSSSDVESIDSVDEEMVAALEKEFFNAS